ncbi:zinc metallochaperone AztD [Burkholderia sp. RS01]|uniref:zinc metallochaperone AztD n=1 Tax=unclassified Burkholderia TaxID=2613784 RepID=UPI003218B179
MNLLLIHPLPAPVRLSLLAGTLGIAVLLAGCGQEAGRTAGTPSGAASDREAAHQNAGPREVRAPEPRLVFTHAGGIGVLDAATLKTVGGTELDGYNRLSPAGDGRHILVAAGDAFRVFDSGVWTERHGDHGHSYAADPQLTSRAFEASMPGHVVRHSGKTVLFSDGSGQVEVFTADRLGAALESGLPATSTYTAPAAHHGVAVELADGKLLVTVGDEEARSGVALLGVAPEGRARAEILRSDDCPGVHGEAVAGEDAVAFGCEDGMLVYKEGKFSKISSPDPYGRMGNQAGSPKSPVVLADYKADKDAVLERPTRISLVNTDSGKLKLVDLGTSYSFRSLGRGPAGEALVLGTDGALHVINPLTGAVTNSIPVVQAWQEPEVWQNPRPTLFVQGATAYVSDPAAKKIHAVDLKSGKVVRSAELEHVPDELTGVTG